MDRPFSLLVKPVGAACNLACDYCFYLKKAALYPDGPRVMPDAVLERMIGSYLALPFDAHTITFQGGEPLLADLAFYRRVAALVPGGEGRFIRSVRAFNPTNGVTRPELGDPVGWKAVFTEFAPEKVVKSAKRFKFEN